MYKVIHGWGDKHNPFKTEMHSAERVRQHAEGGGDVSYSVSKGILKIHLLEHSGPKGEKYQYHVHVGDDEKAKQLGEYAMGYSKEPPK